MNLDHGDPEYGQDYSPVEPMSQRHAKNCTVFLRFSFDPLTREILLASACALATAYVFFGVTRRGYESARPAFASFWCGKQVTVAVASNEGTLRAFRNADCFTTFKIFHRPGALRRRLLFFPSFRGGRSVTLLRMSAQEIMPS